MLRAARTLVVGWMLAAWLLSACAPAATPGEVTALPVTGPTPTEPPATSTEALPTETASPTPAPTATPDPEATPEPLAGQRLLEALRGGGHVIYFRHAATDRTQTDDIEGGDYSNCAEQRNLNDAGRAQARAIGEAFNRLGIPVGRVLASPYCRTRETAELAFGEFETAGSYAETRELTRQLLTTPPAPGPNIVIVAHGFIIQGVAGITIAEGEAAIFQPRSETNTGLLARVLAEHWGSLEASRPQVQEFDVPAGSRPHDVAPAADGTVWYTAQGAGALGRLDPATGEVREIPLGAGSAPHGVIVGPDGAAWVTDSGLNAIVRVDPVTEAVRVFPLPEDRGGANLNTAAFDPNGVLWFTGQSGIFGRLDPGTGAMQIFDAPRGRGPYGITATLDGDVYYASLAGSHIARVDPVAGTATVLEPPTPSQGARRVWSDSQGRVWVSEWNAGQVGMYDPKTNEWREWRLPGPNPQAYAVYVDERDLVWLSDFGANALVSFDPATEAFTAYPLPSPNGAVRQIAGRPGEVWGAESGASQLVLIRSGEGQ